ncbi:MAG TPA: hypothetical protein VFT30_09210, partial [Nitrospira sp.]|nr:hypothetical protein [Nitrospira sp.]
WFVYSSTTDSPQGMGNRDVISDFDGNGGADGDEINLVAIDGNLNMIGHQALTAGQVSYNTGNGNLNVNVIGDPGAIDLQISLAGAPPVNLADDIILA